MRGDTLSSIADRYGTTVEAIAEANGLPVSTILRVGQQLIIPYPGPTGGPGLELPVISAGTVITYVVQAGDSLYFIANMYGTTVEVLMMVNGIKDPALVSIGQELIIAWGTPTPTATSTPEPTATATTPTPKPTTTPESTPTPTVPTSTPTTTTTPTFTPSVTPQPMPTPTSAYSYPAPSLLAPADGQVFQGMDTVIVLNWASVGILAEDEWYVLRLRYEAEGAAQLPNVWTKATSWRVPADLYLPSDVEDRLVYWDVTVMRQTHTTPDGTPGGVDISLASDTRGFYWY
jgi:LysM repeat protein